MTEIDSEITIHVVDTQNVELLVLLQAMSQEMAELYHEDGFTDLVPARMADPRSAFVIAVRGGEAIGCGGIRPLEANVGELKRIYVLPQWRGHGVARRILSILEELGRQFGYRAVRLETGALQDPAIKLYEREGYRRIRCWGEEADDPMSICFEKNL